MVTPNSDKSAWWVKDDYSREEIDQLVQWGIEHFWTQNHQMADLVAPGGYNIMVRGEDCYVYDIEGNKYIDAMAGLFLKSIGHGHPEVASAVAEQMSTLAYTNSGAYSSVPGILWGTLPPTNTRSIFSGTRWLSTSGPPAVSAFAPRHPMDTACDVSRRPGGAACITAAWGWWNMRAMP